jgi:hypothetical protein
MNIGSLELINKFDIISCYGKNFDTSFPIISICHGDNHILFVQVNACDFIVTYQYFLGLGYRVRLRKYVVISEHV